MTVDQTIELIKVLGPVIVSIFGFGFIYKIFVERNQNQKEREKQLISNAFELEKIKNQQIEYWKTRFEQLSKESAKNINNDLKGQLKDNPINALQSNNFKKVIGENIKFFKLISSDELNSLDLDTNTLLVLHMFHYASGQYGESLKYINQAIKQDPFDSHLLSYKSGTLKQIEKYAEALEIAELAIKYDIKNADAYYNKASSLIKLNKKELALDALKTTFKLSEFYIKYTADNKYFTKEEIKQAMPNKR